MSAAVIYLGGCATGVLVAWLIVELADAFVRRRPPGIRRRRDALHLVREWTGTPGDPVERLRGRQ